MDSALKLLVAMALLLSTVPAVGAAGPGSAAAQAKSAVLLDFDDGGSAFSFREGAAVTPGTDAQAYARIDLLLDLPHGLASNNPKVMPFFTGQGGIVDMGPRALDDVKSAASESYVPLLKPDAIKVGHTYCVRVADGQHYAKLHVVRFDPAEARLEFTWRYQGRATTSFDP